VSDPAGTSPTALAAEVIRSCLDLDFALAGVCPALPTSRERQYRDWLAAGRHADMDYLTELLDERLDPRVLVPGARSIIVVADQYAPRADEPPAPGTPGTAPGRIARYARGGDYHRLIKRRLHRLADALRERYPDHAFRSCVDTAPLLEREHAARAGLGWIARNTLLVNPTLGSYLLLGAIVTTLPLAPPPDQPVFPDHCGTCTRCIDACPTGAITPYSVNASRCISYLTIEHRHPIDPSLHGAIGDRLYGCDVCQEVCPHNSARPAPQTGRAPVSRVNAVYAPKRHTLDALHVLAWTADSRREALVGSPMKRATLAMMRRNAIIVGVNACGGDTSLLRPVLERIASDPGEPELVRDTAARALERGERDPKNNRGPGPTDRGRA
jgi:epoxyqueuosine reductase